MKERRATGKGGPGHDWSGQLAPVQSSQPNLGAALTAPPPPGYLLASPLPGAIAASPATTATNGATPTDTGAPQAASVTPAYPALYIFGDSLSDVGNGYIMTGGAAPQAPYDDGRYSNGPLWIEDVAAHFGLADPTPSLDGGDDFAVAGALTGAADIASTGHDLPQQLAGFDQQVTAPVPGALYALDIGANDLNAILANGGGMATMQSAADQSARADIAMIAGLAARGATNFLLPNVPDIGLAPLHNATGAASEAASGLTAYYNAAVTAAVVPLAITDHLNIDIVDLYSLTDAIVANPASYGFTDVTDPVWSGNGTNPDSGTLAATTLAGQDRYLFWDYLHPTASGQALLAGAAENLVFG
jgi:phospholipase/lecithinase/hemolysin